MNRDALPQLGEGVFLTDSGIETDLIENGGFDLPEFAAFVLLDDDAGRQGLDAYFRRHADIAAEHGRGLILETPTWRASQDWGHRIGYSPADLRRVNREGVDLLTALRGDYPGTPIVVSGCVGPRADDYLPGESMTAGEAERYHGAQVAALASAGVALVHAMTIGYVAEAVGVARAAAAVGVPAVISFTTGPDGHLPDGSSLADAIAGVDEATGNGPAYYGVNCTHPAYFGSALPSGAVVGRLRSVRANASADLAPPPGMSAAGMSAAGSADAGAAGFGDTTVPGSPADLAAEYVRLRVEHPEFRILGGCCGTDARHVAAIAAACAGASI